ncbi:MAG: decaprenyl-phosphate phosphoribosyltransferase [Gammaproteobacteria bacterium]|nr:decaprenyl-phosphate phosphoribosyltransferase [Gammaproteobacteria bacterium]
MTKFKDILKLIRLHHYVKNLFIFLPLFFAGQITDLSLLLDTVIAFIAFSLSASAIYILNDYLDINADRQHPVKHTRPLASGAISIKTAMFLLVILGTTGFFLMQYISSQALIFLCVYMTLNICYSYYLKHIAIVDICIIASGFVLRLFVGSSVTDILLSKWIVIMTFLLALFLALAKRRSDILLLKNTGKKMRQVIDGYNLQLVDSSMAIMASVVIVTYLLYTTSGEVTNRLHNDYLYLTSVFVVLGMMRYMQIAFVEQDSGSPTKVLLGDKFTQTTIVAWALSFAWIIYV